LAYLVGQTGTQGSNDLPIVVSHVLTDSPRAPEASKPHRRDAC
jgi:hypothetical protein